MAQRMWSVIIITVLVNTLLVIPLGGVHAEDQFVIDAQVSAGGSFDSNVLNSSDPTSDMVARFSPSVSVVIPLYSRHLDFSIGYRLEGYYYIDNNDLTAMLHNFNLGFGFDKTIESKRVRHLTLVFADRIDTVQRVLHFGEFDPANMAQRNEFNLSGRYRIDLSKRMVIDPYASFKRIDYFNTDEGNNFFDITIGANLKRKVTPNLLLFVGASFSLRKLGYEGIPARLQDFTHPEVNPDQLMRVSDYNSVTGTAGLDMRAGRFTGRLSAGYTMYMLGSNANDVSDIIFEMGMRYRLVRSTSMDLSVDQVYFGDIVGEILLRRSARFRVVRNFGRKTTLRPEVYYTQYESEFTGNFDLMGAKVSVLYDIMNNFNVNLFVNYLQHMQGDILNQPASSYLDDWDRAVIGVLFNYLFRNIRTSL